MSPKTATSVAAILEKELDSMISEWKRQVSLVPSLTNIPLSDADRTGHLTKLFGEVLCRLRGNRNTEPLVSIAAAAHGRLRFAQGYSVAMFDSAARRRARLRLLAFRVPIHWTRNLILLCCG